MLSRNEKVVVLLLSFANILLLYLLVVSKMCISWNFGNTTVAIPQITVSEAIICTEGIPLDGFKEKINSVPVPILQSFQKNHWSFKVTTETDPSLMVNGSFAEGITGTTDYKNKIISVSDPDAVIHEFGHYFWFMLQDPDGVENLYNLEAENGENVLGAYSRTNSREYFAEYFKFIITKQESIDDLDLLQSATPQTFQYFLDAMDFHPVILTDIL